MERSKHLHNFDLPTWGRQKSLRCMNVDPLHPMPAVEDDESSDSGEFNEHRSPDNPHAEDQEVHRFEGERLTDYQPRMKLSFKLNSGLPPSKASPLPPPIHEEIGAETEDPKSEKKSLRPRRKLDKKEERPRFSIALSRKEIEEDFLAMTGKKPPRKPNKHPKNVQKKLDDVFPGLWLSEVHPDRYKVDENGKT